MEQCNLGGNSHHIRDRIPKLTALNIIYQQDGDPHGNIHYLGIILGTFNVCR